MANEPAPNPAPAAPNPAPAPPASALGGMPSDPAPVDPATATPPPPAPSSVTFPDNWKDGIPEEFRGDQSLAPIKSVQELAKGFIHAQKMIGKDKVVVPDAKFATEDDWKGFFHKVGLPREEKDYTLKKPAGEAVDDKYLGEFKDAAFKMNILPQQAQKLVDWYAQKETELAEAARADAMAAVQKGLDDYKTQVGVAYDKKVMLANKTLEKFGGAEAQKFMASNPAVGSNPQMIEMLAKIGEHLYGEDPMPQAGGSPGAMTPKDAQSKINDVYADPSHPYFEQLHPKHKEATEYMRKLFQMANP